MNGLKTNNAPNSSVVVPHFIFGAISFFLLAVMLFLSSSNLLEVYFNNKLVAITHMGVLGWATMIIFGALYQLIPVVFETALFSEKLAKFTFWISVFSVCFLCYSFWVASYTILLPYASLCMFFSLLLFVVNVLLSHQKSAIKNWSSRLVVAAIIWLLITEILGTLVALNFKFNFFNETHIHYLKIHATIGLVGWFLLLIIGVGSTLIPMFLISHELNKNKLKASFYFINIGLLLFILNGFFINVSSLIYINWLLIAFGVLFFVSFIYDSFKKRMRKKLDVGMQYSMIAIASILLPIVISSVLILRFNFQFELLSRITIFYGFSILFGFITTLILGQTYKTLPFIIWLDRYKKLVGKTKTPLPRELYSNRIASIQFYLYLIFIILTPIGVLLNTEIIVKLGCFTLLLVSVLYMTNVFKIILHKVKPIENE